MEKIISKANNLKYSSLNYVDIEDIKEAKSIINNDSVIFMYQNSAAKKEIYWESNSNYSFQLFWAADSIESFLDEMGSIGFNIVSEWVDYWNTELRRTETVCDDTINVETINEKDISTASNITKSCAGYSRGFIGQSEELIREWMNTEDSYLFLAKVDRKLVGLCFVMLYGFDSDKGIVLWIRELVVNPEYHSKGIGRQLIVHGINWGIENRSRRSFLAVDSENYNAIKLYESLGYKRKDERGQINMELTL